MPEMEVEERVEVQLAWNMSVWEWAPGSSDLEKEVEQSNFNRQE